MLLINFSKNLTAALILIVLFTCAAAFGQQYKGNPVTKERLVTALRTKALQTRQIVQTVTNNGVDFQATPNVEAELVSAGARPEVLTAVRNNYRAPVNNSKPSVVNNNSGAKVVTKAGLIKTIKTKSASNGAIIDLIESNGVNFETTAAVENELKTAGASPAIIAAAKGAYQGPTSVYNNNTNASSGNNNSSGGKTKPASIGYDDLISQAIESYNRDVNSNAAANSPGRLEAIQTLNKAITMDANNPVGYQQLGFMTLYGTNNGFAAAEANFKKAIELGGSAVFRVFHDHNGTFSDTCNGSLYVSKDNVRFESDDNKHTFDVSDADIKNVKTNNSFIKAFQLKQGSYKIVLKNGDGSKNFNFAPLTANNEESKIVIRLIGK